MNTCDWKPTFVFPDEYLVSDHGDVFSLRTNRLLKPATDKDGYLYYVLCVKGVRKTIKAHRLVAKAFVENPYNKPAIDHINGIKGDNHANNLRWVTNKENTNNPNTKNNLLESLELRLPKLYEAAKRMNFNRKSVLIQWNDGAKEVFPSLKSAALATGKNYSKLSEILNGKRKQDAKFKAKWAKQHFGDDDAGTVGDVNKYL